MKLRYSACLIPAYNEEKNIEEVVRRTKKTRLFDKIVVIDDGSKDRTAEIAKLCGAIVIRHKKNRGKGEALKTGFNYVLKKNIKYIVLIDADLQYDPSESKKILKPLSEGADFVMGCRSWKTVPLRHRMGNFVWRGFFNLFFGTSFKDTNCGFIAMTKECVKKIKIHGGYIIENSMLADCVKNNLRVVQVPVRVNYKNVSRIPRGFKMVSGVLFFIVKEGMKYNLKRCFNGNLGRKMERR